MYIYNNIIVIIGIDDKKKLPQSNSDERAEQLMLELTKRSDDESRWETGLLWKKNDMVLPGSYPTALHRLKCLERQMDKDHALENVYNKKIEEYVEKRFCRKLSAKEIANTNDRVW